jgi:glycosyltransferase involved in cell wall biosynthesis
LQGGYNKPLRHFAYLVITRMSQQPRICILVDRYPPHIGGVEVQARQLSVQLAQRGTPVIVITRRVDNTLPPVESDEGVTVYRVPPRGARSHLTNIKSIFPVTFALIKHRKKYDLLHVHDMFALVICAVLVKLLIGKPFIIKVPSYGNIRRRASATTRVSLYSRLLHHVILPPRLWYWLLGRAAVFIAISEAITQELQSTGFAAKIRRIPNAVDTTRFCPASLAEKESLRRQLGLPVDTILIAWHGRISRLKRLDVLINALARLPDPDIILVLAGPPNPLEADLTSELQAQIASSGLTERVHFTGETQYPEHYLRAADFFVLPSEREGMPNSLLEAMACGLPACASRLEGVIDLIEDGKNGLLFDVGDAEMLAECLRAYLNDTELPHAMGKNALETVLQAYTWDAITPHYQELYREILSNA